MRKTAGFTLLEIMLVLVLMGMISVGVVMTLPSSGSTAQGSQWYAQRFSTLLQLAEDQALISNAELGIEFNEQSFIFLIYDYSTQKWLPLINERINGSVTLPETITAHYTLDGNVWGELDTLQNRTNNYSLFDEGSGFEVNDFYPHVFIMSSGEVTPFNYQFTNNEDDQGSVTVKVTMTGEIDIEQTNE